MDHTDEARGAARALFATDYPDEQPEQTEQTEPPSEQHQLARRLFSITTEEN